MAQPETSNADITVFDRHRIKHNRERARATFEQYDFLYEWSRKNLADRLLDINRTFENTVNLGSRCPITKHDKIENVLTLDLCDAPLSDINGHYVQADEEFLPLKQQSCDLIISNLNLHFVNDLPGALLQIKNALKRDGLFIASILGGETLHELRQTFTETEIEMYQGISPRIAPFADKAQMGDLLQRAGFALPVVDSDIITVTYDHIFKLMHDLRGMGENNAISARQKTPSQRQFFMNAAQRYQENHAESDGRIPASFEVIFLLGWAPHESQQKPLRPGSAEHSLAEALNTTEIKTGEKTTP